MPELELLDISLPSDVPWYSFSLLTWTLIVLFFISVVAFTYWFFIIRKQSKKYILFKEMSKKLDQIENRVNEGQISNHQFAQIIDQLLKRLLKSFLNENHLKEMDSNEKWFEFLNSQVKKNQLDNSFKSIFIKASYTPDLDFDKDDYLNSLKNYLMELKKTI